MEPKRILVLTADAGFGHRSAANAIVAALKDEYGQQVTVELSNPLEDKRTPMLLRDSQSDYDKIVRTAPELYRLGYDASDGTVPGAILESALTVLLFEVLWDVVREKRPDVIVTTYPLYQAPLDAVFSVSRQYAPLITVVTDLATVHRLWFHPEVDACLVPTPLVRELAIAYGLEPEKIHLTGIPISPLVASETRTQAEIRRDLGWDERLPTVLAVGSKRVDRLLDTLNVLNHYGAPLQLAVVAGKDAELYRELKETLWHQPVHLYEYLPNVPTLMLAADCVVCKAGGLVVTEALAAGRPLMLIDAIPGQETGNADYVLHGGAGEMALTEPSVLQVMTHWLMDDRKLLHLRAENARRLGHPEAARETARLVWNAAQRGVVSKKRILGREKLLELLTNNHIHWQELLSDKLKFL